MNCAIKGLINGLCSFRLIRYIRLAMSHRLIYLILLSHYLQLLSYQSQLSTSDISYDGKPRLSH
jgi:hypothetical protein